MAKVQVNFTSFENSGQYENQIDNNDVRNKNVTFYYDNGRLEIFIDGVEVLNDKINLIDTIKSNSLGFNNRVGPNALTRQPTDLAGTVGRNASVVGIGPLITGSITEATGAGQQFAGAVHRLASTEFINNLIEAKKAGATFGSLTDREGDALRAAATLIS